MSHYQYYEFRAIDRPLTEQQRRMLRSLSTRAQITPTSFVNTYDWGDFSGDPDELMETCFDAFVYLSNCGIRQFSVRLPAKCFNTAISGSNSAIQSFRARDNGEFVVLDFLGDDQGADETEGEGWMDSLLPLRADLLRGDQRCLYLGWLCTLEMDDFDEEEPEPPVPPGLQSLTESLKAFVDFLNIDADLLEVASRDSAPEDPPPSRTAIAAWIRAWPESEKDTLLIAAAMDEGMQTGAEILRRYDLARLQKSAVLEVPPAGLPASLSLPPRNSPPKRRSWPPDAKPPSERASSARPPKRENNTSTSYHATKTSLGSASRLPFRPSSKSNMTSP